MTEKEIEISEYIPLREVAFSSLRDSIIKGKVKPGQRLMEIQLSQEMGVSRTPVREAIRKLQLEGLVIMHPRKGAIVAPINPRDLKEILEVRRALEKLACHLASERASAEAVKRLTDIHNAMIEAIAIDDLELITEKDVEFHETITEIAGNEHLQAMLDQIKAHLFRYRREFIKELGDRKVLILEHAAILDAITGGNAALAEKSVDVHIERQEKYILKTLEEV